jgi:hypothetical protein
MGYPDGKQLNMKAPHFQFGKANFYPDLFLLIIPFPVLPFAGIMIKNK